MEDESMEEGDDPLHVHHEPDSIVPDRGEDVEEEEEGDISQESDSDGDDSSDDESNDKEEVKKKPRVKMTNSDTSDSDSGVDDPTPESKGALYKMLSEAVQRTKQQARLRKEEEWIRQDGEDDKVEVGKGKDQSYKQLPKVEKSCGIRELYVIPEKNVIGSKLHAICRHILNTNIMISPLNQEFTQNSHGHPSMVLGAWKSQLEERYKMKTNFWKEEEDKLLRSRCNELVEEELCEDADELADLINSQTGSGTERKPKKRNRDPSARNIVGLYLGMDLPHRTAFECSQRLVQLVKGVSVLNKRDKELSMARVKVKQENSTPRKVKTMWTEDEDMLLVKLVLQRKSGNYKTVDKTDHRPQDSKAELRIPWVTMSEQFENRKWTCLRDRWQVHLKPVLERPDLWETTDALVGLDCDLLRAVAETGAKSLQTVPWDKVMEAVPGHLPAFLKSRLRGLTRQPNEAANNLNEKVEQILHNMQAGKALSTGSSKRSGRRMKRMETTMERNANLIEYYQRLISRNKE